MTKPANPGVGAPLAGARGAPDGRRQAVSTGSRPRASRGATPLRSSLWLWVAGAFLFLGLLWTALFLAAKSANIESVPLAPKGARP